MKNDKLYVSKLAYNMMAKMGAEQDAENAIYNEAMRHFGAEEAITVAKDVISDIKNTYESYKQFSGWNRIYGKDAEVEIERQMKDNWSQFAGIKRIAGEQKTIPYGFLTSIDKTLDSPDRLGTFSSTAQKVPRRITKKMFVTQKHQKIVIPYNWIYNNMFDPQFESKLLARYEESFWEDMADLAWNGTANTGSTFYTLQKGYITIMKATSDTVQTPEGDNVVYSWGGDENVVNKIAASSAWTCKTICNDIDKCIEAMKTNIKTRHFMNKGGYEVLMSDANFLKFQNGAVAEYVNDGSSNLAGNTDFRDAKRASGEYLDFRGHKVKAMPYFPDTVIIFARMSDFLMGYQTQIMESYERKAELTAEDAVIAGEGAGSPGIVINKNYFTDLNIVNPSAMCIVYANAKCETPKVFDSAKNVANVVTAGVGAGDLTVYPFCATPGCELYADSSTISDTYATAAAAATKVEKGDAYVIDDEATGYFKAFRDGIALPSTQLVVVNES